MKAIQVVAVLVAAYCSNEVYASDLDLKRELNAVIGDPRIVVDLNREQVIGQLVRNWKERLAGSLGTEEAASRLRALSSQELYEAALNESFEGVQSILYGQAREAERRTPKLLGDLSADLAYTPINPCRILDTRNAGGPLAANTSRTFDGYSTNFSSQGGTASNCGLPSGVAAIAMNVYAVNPTNLGFIKVWPANGAEPAVSTVNYQVGIAAIATGAIVPVDSANNNRFSAKSSAQVDFIADVVGYFRQARGSAATVAPAIACTSIAPNGFSFQAAPACPAGKVMVSGGCTTGSFLVLLVVSDRDANTGANWVCAYSSYSGLFQSVCASTLCQDIPAKAN